MESPRVPFARWVQNVTGTRMRERQKVNSTAYFCWGILVPEGRSGILLKRQGLRGAVPIASFVVKTLGAVG